jgi:tripartite-type tricarboxylate transporter receptor subunit TctC
VASISRVPNVMVVHPSFPAKTVPEFIAYTRANPGKISMASPGIGSPQHVAGELFKMMTGVFRRRSERSKRANSGLMHRSKYSFDQLVRTKKE